MRFGSRSTRAIARERLEVIRAGAFRRQQQEHDIDRLIVQRLEIDRGVQPRENARNAVEIGEFAVRNGDSLADAGRAETLTLQDRVENRPGGDARQFRCLFRDCLEKLFLGAHPQIRDDRFLSDNITEIHSSVLADSPSQGTRSVTRFERLQLRLLDRARIYPANVSVGAAVYEIHVPRCLHCGTHIPGCPAGPVAKPRKPRAS